MLLIIDNYYLLLLIINYSCLLLLIINTPGVGLFPNQDEVPEAQLDSEDSDKTSSFQSVGSISEDLIKVGERYHINY